MNGALRYRIKITSRFVEEEQRRVLQQCARDAYALLLPCGQAPPLLVPADYRVVAVLCKHDLFVDIRCLGRCDDVVHRRARARETDIVGDRVHE